MKLHLPKSLRAALLGCMSLLAPTATTLSSATMIAGAVAYSLMAQAQAEDLLINQSYSNDDTTDAGINANLFLSAGADDTVFVDLSSGSFTWSGDLTCDAGKFVIYEATLTNGSSNRTYYFNSDFRDATTAELIAYYGLTEVDSTDAAAVLAAAKEAGYTGSLNFTSWTGADGVNQVYNFTGDMSAFSGDIISASCGLSLNFTGVARTSVSGTGAILLSGARSLSYTLAGDSTINNSSITLATSTTTMSLNGAVNYTLNSQLILTGTLTNNATSATLNGVITFNETGQIVNSEGCNMTITGTLALSSANQITNNGTLNLGSGLVFDLSGLSDADWVLDATTNSASFVVIDGYDLSGFTASDITGLDMTGKANLSFNSDGTITYDLTVSVLSFSGGSLTWSDGVDDFDNDKTFTNDDFVIFQTADAEVTLGGNVSSLKIEVNDSINLILTGNGNTLTSGNITMADGSSITLKDAALSEDSSLAGSSASSSLIYDFGEDTVATTGTYLTGYTGQLVVNSGSLAFTDADDAYGYASLTVNDGATLSLGNASIDQTVTFNGDATLNVEYIYDGIYDGTLAVIAGSGTLTKTGAGQLRLSGNITHSGSFDVTEGEVNFGHGNQDATNTLGFTEIIIRSGATFTWEHDSSDQSHTALQLDGGTFSQTDSGTVGGVTTWKSLLVSKDSSYLCGWDSSTTFNKLTAIDDAELTFGSSGGTTTGDTITVNNLVDFDGTISIDSDYTNNFVIQNVSVAEGVSTIIDRDGGTVQATNLVIGGTGSFTANNITITGQLGMYSDATVSLTALIINNGATLNYSSDLGSTFISFGSIALADDVTGLSLFFGDVSAEELNLAINLGLSSDIFTDSSIFNVAGLTSDQYSIVADADGNWILTLTDTPDYSVANWDDNWGYEVLLNAPATFETITTLDAATNLAADDTYKVVVNGQTVIAAKIDGVGTAEAPIAYIVAGSLAADYNTSISDLYVGDTWMEMASGYVGALIGGNYANNWYYGTVLNFVGDSHIVVDGGSVDYVIGGNHRDGLVAAYGTTASFTGDSYISVNTSINGAIIGGNTSTHAGLPSFNGDTNIFVYVPQNSSAAPTFEGLAGKLGVFGGSYWFTHSSGAAMSHSGDTHVTIDLSDYTLAETGNEFTGVIAGGSYTGTSSASATHTGNTNVSIEGLEGVNFAGVVMGGNSATSTGANTITGTSSLTITGDSTFGSFVVGGSYVTANSKTTVGSVEMNLNGGTFNGDHVIAGSYLTTSNSGGISIGDININIDGGQVLSQNLYGGIFANGTSGETSVGNISLVMTSGTLTWSFLGSCSNGSDTYAITQGAMSAELLGGTITGSFFAAGRAVTASSQLTTESTCITIGSGLVLDNGEGGTVRINGGYKMDDASANATVTGNQTLKFIDTSYDNLAAALFENFTHVEVAEGANVDFGSITTATTIQSMSVTGDALTKTGAGSLTLAGGNTGSLSIEAGSLILSSAGGDSFTAITVAGGATLNTSASSSSTVGNLNLADGAIVSMGDSGISLGASGSLTLGGKFQLNLGSSLGEEFSLILFDGITDSNLSGLTLTEIDDDVWGVLASDVISTDGSWSLDSDAYIVLNEGQLLLTNVFGGEDLIWAGGDNGTWLDDGSTGWTDEEGATVGFTYKDSVTFDSTGFGDGTVTVEDDGVSLKAMSITADGYSFSGGDITIGATFDLADGVGASFTNTLDLSAATATIGDGAELTLATNTTIKKLVNEGTISSTADLTITGATTTGGTINAANLNLSSADDYSFTQLTITGDLNNNGAAHITLGDGSSISGKLSGGELSIGNGASVSIGSIGEEGLKALTVSTSSTLTLGGALIVGTNGLTNGGTINLSNADGSVRYDATLQSATTQGGTLTAANVSLTGDNIFTKLDASGNVTSTGSLTLGAGSSIGGELSGGSLIVTSGDVSIEDVGDSMGSITNNGTGTITIRDEVTLTGTLNNADGSLSLSITKDDGTLGYYNMTVGEGIADGGNLAVNTINLATGSNNTFDKLVAESQVGYGSNGAATGDGGTLTVGDGSSMGSLLGGGLVTTGNVTIGTVAADGLTGLNNGSGNLSIGSALTVGTGGFSNAGSIVLQDASGTRYDFNSSSAAGANGGSLTAANVTLTGDNSFTLLDATGTVDSTATLTINGNSSMAALVGGGSLVANADVDITGTDATTLVQLTGTGDVSFGGALTLTGNSANSAGALTVAGSLDLQGLTASSFGSLSVGGNLSTNAALSVTNAASIAGSTLTLGGALSAGGELSLGANIAETATINLDYQISASSPAITADSLVTNGSGLNIVADATMLYNLGLSSGYTLNLTDLGVDFTDDVTLNGVTEFIVSSGYIMSIAVVDGNIQLSVSVTGDEWVSTDGYWSGSNSWGGTGVPAEDTVALLAGKGSSKIYIDGNVVANSFIVEVEDGTPNDSYTLSQAEGVQDASLSTGSMSVTKGELVIDDVTVNVVNDDELFTGATPLGTVVVGSVSANAGDASLIVKEDGVLNTQYMSINADYAEGATGFSNAGTTTVAGSLLAEHVTIHNTGLLSVGEGSKINAIIGNGTLTISEDASASITSFDAAGKLSLASGSELTVLADMSLKNFSSEGTLNMGDNSLTFTEAITNGGSIVSTDDELGVVIDKQASFSSMDVKLITLNTLVAGGETAAIATMAVTTDYVLSTGILNVSSGQTVSLALTSLSTDTLGTYSLITGEKYDASGELTNITWSDFTFDAATTAVIAQLICEEGRDVYKRVDENGGLELYIVDAGDRNWNVTSDTAYSSTAGDEDRDPDLVFTVVDENGKLTSNDVLDSIDKVIIDGDRDITMADDDDSLMLNDLNGANPSATLSITGAGMDEDSVILANETSNVVLGTLAVEDLTLTVDGSYEGDLYLANLELTGSKLVIEEADDLTVGALIGDEDSIISGNLSLTGSGTKYEGSYDDATIALNNGATATFDVEAATGLTLTGGSGYASLSNASGGVITQIETTGASVYLGAISSKGGALELLESSSMTGGSLSFSVSTGDLSDSIANGGSLVITTGNTLQLTGTSIIIGQSDIASSLDVGSATTDIVLFQLSDIAQGGDAGDNEVIFASNLYNKYFTNGRYDASTGLVIADRNDSAYNSMAQTENGAAGLNLVSKVLFELDPENQEDMKDGALADVISSMDSYKAMGAYGAADALAAAVAGSSTTSLGSAAVSDVERQLRSIRNRTKMMGVDPSVVNEDMPYFNGWIAAEGGSSTLDADGTHAGHKLNNFGGSVGVDVDLNDMVSVGASFTALYGDLTGDGADMAEGDFNTMYGSLFARVNNKRWTHSFVATFGAIDATLDRTVSMTDGKSYKTKGETDGTAFGLMYEVGYTYALTEDASTCLQPIFNVALVNSSIGGYTETGSDAALMVGDQDNNYVTFGLGGLLETVVGENVYNRASVLSARAMMKFDAGDRQSEADVTLLGTTETVKGAEVGAVGIELGLGLTIPVTEEVGAIFMDVSCEFRSGYTNVNGSVGYRFSF